MKRTFFSLLLGAAALIAPQTASATLLVGFHSFDNNLLAESADTVLSGFSGSITKGGIAPGTSPGSDDGTYGPVLSGAGINNGRLEGANGVTLSVTNGSTSNYSLTSLLFDGRHNGGVNTSVQYYVSWVSPNGSGSSTETMVASALNATANNYSDFVVNLGSIFLAVGQSITFTWTTNQPLVPAGGRLDNIALTGTLSAIPEPGSLVALGCLVGSGAFLRTRRRKVLAGVA